MAQAIRKRNFIAVPNLHCVGPSTCIQRHLVGIRLQRLSVCHTWSFRRAAVCRFVFGQVLCSWHGKRRNGLALRHPARRRPDPISGQRIWRFQGEVEGSVPRLMTRSPALSGDRIFFGGRAGNIYALSKKTVNCFGHAKSAPAFRLRWWLTRKAFILAQPTTPSIELHKIAVK